MIEKKFGTTVKLLKGRGGVFDVAVDRKRIYSKHKTGRFPEHAEILEAIEKLSSAPDRTD